MKITPLSLQGVYEIILEPDQDDRGYFVRTYDVDIFRQHNLVTRWKQESKSYSKMSGIIRGLHFQLPPYAETKLISVESGAIWDVFVDLRTRSDTYGHWGTIELSANNQKMVYIPKGCAHGFCTLTDSVIVHYKMDVSYVANLQNGIIWNDTSLNIPWPERNPILSERDKLFPTFCDFSSPF